jgi:hypothetical protein
VILELATPVAPNLAGQNVNREGREGFAQIAKKSRTLPKGVNKD